MEAISDYYYYQPVLEEIDNVDDEQSNYFPHIHTIVDSNQLPPLSNSFKSKPKKKLDVKAKVQTRFPRLNLKKHSIQIRHKIHNNFTLNERRIINNALQFVARCFMNPENLKNMYHICGTSGYYLKENVWERSLLETHQTDHDYHYLLCYQLMCLKVTSDTNELPIINIYPIYETTDVLGRGEVGCVSCTSFKSIVLTDGEFHVHLNRYHLGARGKVGTNAIFWAGVIVHEMLHNLGHAHDEHDTTHRWQINAFEECFTHNAKYPS